jgi:hypothetical protein
MNDGLQTSHSSKFVYGLWRPITAIQRAGEDLNDQTTADPAWTPLLGTPTYPSHSSNVACIASRVYGGIHFMFELDASNEACTKVADFLADHYMQRRW